MYPSVPYDRQFEDAGRSEFFLLILLQNSRVPVCRHNRFATEAD